MDPPPSKRSRTGKGRADQLDRFETSSSVESRVGTSSSSIHSVHTGYRSTGSTDQWAFSQGTASSHPFHQSISLPGIESLSTSSSNGIHSNFMARFSEGFGTPNLMSSPLARPMHLTGDMPGFLQRVPAGSSDLHPLLQQLSSAQAYWRPMPSAPTRPTYHPNLEPFRPSLGLGSHESMQNPSVSANSFIDPRAAMLAQMLPRESLSMPSLSHPLMSLTAQAGVGMQLNSRTSTPAQSGVRIPIGSVPAAHPLIPDISIQHLRNIDPEMDRARDEALKTAEADRARFRREQRRKWICGDVLAYPELAGSSVLQGLRACAPFCALSCIQVQLEDDTAAASPSPSTSTGADHPPASDPRPVPTHRPLFGLKRDLAVLLELELDARKWYGTAAAPYFEELGCRLEQHLRGLGGGGGGGAPGPLDTQNHGQRSAGRPNGAGCDAGGAGMAAAAAAASALLAEAQEVCNRPGGRSMRGLARCNGVSAAQRHCMLTCPRRWHVAAAEAGVHTRGPAAEQCRGPSSSSDPPPPSLPSRRQGLYKLPSVPGQVRRRPARAQGTGTIWRARRRALMMATCSRRPGAGGRG